MTTPQKSSPRRPPARTSAPAPRPARTSAPAPRPARPYPRLRLGLALALLLAALAAALWSWRQYARPGAAHLQRGLDAEAAGQTPQAEQEWLAGVQEDPGFAPVRVQLGDLYMQEQRFPEAAAQYNAAARLTPDDGTLFLKLNRADMAMKDIPGMRAAAKRAAELRPDDPDALGLYGLLEAKYEDRAGALTALRRAHQLRPDDRDYLINLVKLELRMSDFPDADRDLTPWQRAHPRDAWAGHLMAVIDAQKPSSPATVRAAIALERQAQAAMPPDMRICIVLGELYLTAGRPADALRTYRAGLRIDPNSEEMLHGLVTAYTRLGRTGQAAAAAARLLTETTRHQRITHLGDIVGLKPADVAAWQEKAALQEQDGNFAGAGATLTQMARRDPQDPRARAALAAFYRRVHRPDLAKQAADPKFVP